jgi:chromatin remodeling complex protein RSC6
LWKLGADERETFKNADFMFRQMQIDHEAALAEAKNATDVMRINKEFEVHKQNLMQNESQFQRSLTQAAALSKDANTTNVTVANAYASATKAAAESNASAGKKSDAERDSIMAKNLGETVESMFAGEPKTPDLPARKIAVYNQLYQVGSARAYAEERKGYVAQENGKYVIVTKSDKGNYFSAPAPEFKPLTYIPPPPRAK